MAIHCDNAIKLIDTPTSKAFVASTELDGFIKYKNTTPIELSDESMAKLMLISKAKDLQGIGIYTESGLPVAYSNEYYIMRDYVIGYADKDDFMGMFRILYGEDEIGFRSLQDRIRKDMDFFFSQIEKGRVKETQQEYFFRLIRLIRDDEYNDIKLLLALHPDMRETLTYEALFKDYFNVDFSKPRDYLRLRKAIARQGGIYASLPEFRTFKGSMSEWFSKEHREESWSSHTYYRYLPDEVKVFYHRELFEIPEGYEFHELSGEKRTLVGGDKAYVTNDQFLKFSKADQEKFFEALFESYKQANPENVKLLEQSIEKSKNHFVIAHIGWTGLSGFYRLMKGMMNPILYAGTLIMHKTGAIAMLALNSFLHLPRYLANENMNIGLSGDWGEFCKKNGIFERDISFWNLTKDAWKRGEKGDSFMYAAIGLRREFFKLAEAQFFNVADTAMTAYYRRNLTEEFLSIKYPHITSFEQYTDMLSVMDKATRDKEIKQMLTYIDDKMYKRFNNSIDTTRYTKGGVIVSDKIGDFGQEILNLGGDMWSFYRRYMVNYSDNIMSTVKGGWSGVRQNDSKELMEQFFDNKKTRQEVSDIIDARFANNQDLNYLLTTALYSTLLANMIFKYDIHGNGYSEDTTNDGVLLNEWFDLYKLFFFPIEAINKTTQMMLLQSIFDAMSLDLGIGENAKLIGGYEYSTITKQLFKGLWLGKGIVKLIGDIVADNKDEWNTLSDYGRIKRIMSDLTSAIHGYGYYLLDDITRQGFEEYTPKTQTALLKDIFGTREYAIQKYDDINKKIGIIKIGDWDSFKNWLTYHTPFVAQFYQAAFPDKSSGVGEAIKQRQNDPKYRSMIQGILPKGVTDEELLAFYGMMTKYNPTDINDISLNFLVDWSWENDDGEIAHDYNKEAVEKIWHDLMLDSVDKNLLKEAVRLFTTADETYQAQALTALLYLEANTPGSGQKLLGYLANYELIQNVYFSGKYGYFKKQEDGKYTPLDEARRQDAMRKEKIEIARKYFEYEHILDKEIWAQATLKIAKDDPTLLISEYIKDTNEKGTQKLGLYPKKFATLESNSEEGDYISLDTEMLEIYNLNTYALMAAAEGYPDGYKLNNMFSSLFSLSGKKKNGKLTQQGAKAIVFAYNALNELLQDMGLSEPERVVMQSVALVQSDQALSAIIDDIKERGGDVNTDPTVQTALHFLWGTANKINQLSDRAISETVQKKQTGTDPSDISLSWATNSNGTKKSGYSNWKQYYNKNQYFYDQVKYMTSKYHKYYNYLYTPKSTNVKSYYTEKERNAKQFGPGLASVKGSSSSRRGSNQQQKPGGSLTQQRGKARPFTNRGDLDKIPDRRTKPKNRRTRAYAVGAKLWNKLIPGRRRYIKARQSDIPTMT